MAPTSTQTSDSNSCWLMKAEPETRLEKGKDVAFSIHHLESCPNQTTIWDGVRNHQAKNIMISMKQEQKVLFYHSNCKVPGIAGLAKISSKESFPDPSAFDANHPYFDPKSNKEKPTWFTVEVKFVSKFDQIVPLELLKMIGNDQLNEDQRKGLNQILTKEMIDGVAGMTLIKTSRLSVQPVSLNAYDAVVALASNPEVWSAWPGKWNPSRTSSSSSSDPKVAAKSESKKEGNQVQNEIRTSGRNKRKVQEDISAVEEEKVEKKKSRTKGKK